jgi:hypothetical protein
MDEILYLVYFLFSINEAEADFIMQLYIIKIYKNYSDNSINKEYKKHFINYYFLYNISFVHSIIP